MFARLLVDKGAARVYLGGRREQFLQKAIENIGNPKIAAVKCDVMNKDSLRAAADFVERDAGFLNLLICGAGLSGPEPAHLDDHTTLEEWAQGNFAADFQGYVDTFAANVAAPWYTTMAFLKLLDLGNKKQNLLQNSQVLITSPYAAFDRVASAGWAYCQSKTAATLAANQLARVLPQWDIR
ncbi:NAD(P)-binding domain protein [Moelleriella libera RCEF 2490]|uniref:NAD(P)-binding domain protein n=1 Tax=Moelleriella libera RCEF 2490 TaxID=1081109 RepID=A0A167ZQR4_9HYPO|nr:NAD(P)-binding domain protein [Moelleriella libera RCEF 2490]